MMAEQKKRLPANHNVRKVKYWDLRSDALDIFEPQLMAAVGAAGRSADSAPDGQLRMVEDPATKVRTFLGKQSFVVGMGLPVRRVVSFWTGSGPPISASGQFLR
jgi:hypothetical protein